MMLGFRPSPARYSRPGRAFLGLNRLTETPKHSNAPVDHRNRITDFWTPTIRTGTTPTAPAGEKKNSNDLLVENGFLSQAYSGIFHMMPLGLRVQGKLEGLIDKHMRPLRASKVSLSSISSQKLWEKSGRLDDKTAEIFRFEDRKKTPYLLAPTHEEEITTLVGSLVRSYKDLPVRVYQISRKYRDEQRPRQGLLRGREFIMKDLYTFDCNKRMALKSYTHVLNAYRALFDELKLPYLVAAADSGNMGGSLSHEFHFPSDKGEDTVISCTACDNVFNEELSDGKQSRHVRARRQSRQPPGFDTGEASGEASGEATREGAEPVSVDMWMAVSKDKGTLLRCWYPKFIIQNNLQAPTLREINTHAVKSIAKESGIDLDMGIKDPLQRWSDHVKNAGQRPHIIDVYDARVRPYERPPLMNTLEGLNCTRDDVDFGKLEHFPGNPDQLFDLVRVIDNDPCTKCSKGLSRTQTATELGHTFYLGTRYSKILQATVKADKSVLDAKDIIESPSQDQDVPMEMGCHGIGVSRMISAIADTLVDNTGLNWPRAIAPFEVAIITVKGMDDVGEDVYDRLMSDASNPMDIVLDARPTTLPWKLTDADRIGYPVLIVIGKKWQEEKRLEVQCRQLKIREYVDLVDLTNFVTALLNKL
ncbi:prolyl-tRNA synthetase [Aspergillus ellipticus CBS 707.79]|uniref:proline--tRNA ligase n=1 Tax=Aspergillus ellipticus CBS 707.79 TaxID=1448320 RepID=A0A319D4Y8_9EURO|nr:prolyl-tRNA synthetase [Aspergillus ellipticus CBS 707.79]